MKWKDVYPRWLDGETFFKMLTVWAPWDKTDETADNLSRIYFGTHSGNKTVCSVVEEIINNGTWKLSIDVLISRMLQSQYSSKWNRLWNTMIMEYDPVSIYNVTEEGKRNATKDGTTITDDTLTQTGSTTTTDTPDLTVVNSGDNTNTETRNLTTESTTYSFGFNSANTDKDKSGETESVDGGTSKNVNELNTRTQTTGSSVNEEAIDRKDQKKIIVDDNNTTDETYSVTKKGNLGHMSIQSILEQEISLRQWEFFENVFQDIDRLLTIPIYEH